MKKRVFQYLALFLAQFIAYPVFQLYFSLVNIRVIHWERYRRLLRNGQGVIIVLWHENFQVPIWVFRHRGIYALVSQHFDGEVIARILKRIGYRTIRGSSTRGGLQALEQLRQVLQNRGHIAITPDGPTGPRRKVKFGAVKLASETGIPILPLGYAATREKRMNSWDKFRVVLPFGRSVVYVGEPLYFPPLPSMKKLVQAARRLEDAINETDRKAEHYLS